MKKLITIALLLLPLLSLNAKTHSRCRAYSVLEYDANVPAGIYRHDSAQFFYSLGRPGDYIAHINYWQLKYDKAVYFSAKTGTWKPTDIVYQTFDSKNNTTQSVTLNANTLDSTKRTDFTYTPANDTTSVINYIYKNHNWVYESKIERAVDASHHVLSVANYEWDIFSGKWKGSYKWDYTYDPSGRVIERLSPIWMNSSASWRNNFRAEYVYTGSDLDSIKQYRWSGNTWLLQSIAVTTYTAGLITNNLTLSYNQTNLKWDSTLKYTYTYNTLGLNDTEYMFPNGNMSIPYIRLIRTYDTANYLTGMIQQSWSGFWRNTHLYPLTYDSLHNETSFGGISWDGNNWSFQSSDYMLYIYFDSYSEYESVAKTQNDNYKFIIYPVPSSGVINVYAEWKDVQPFFISVTDMQGNTLRRWDEKPANKYQGTIHTSEMPPGNYILSIRNNSGIISKQFIVNN